MLQIVDENTHMWRILKGFSNIEQIDIKEIEAKYGIKKSQFLDLKSLKGDASDNIPGVPGIGEKTAAKLLNDYQTLDGIYEHIDDITGSTKTKLEAGKDSAYLSKKLAKIMFDAPIKLNDIPDFVFDSGQVISGLKKLEFNSLIRKIDNNVEVKKEEKININVPKDVIVDNDIKSLMHSNKEIADKILKGASFWDLNQAEFLLNPLSREKGTMSYEDELKEFQKYPKLYSIYRDFDLPLIPVLYQMEEKGMLIDREYFKKLHLEYEKEVENLEQKIYSIAGKIFNINSPIQLSEVLFTDLNLPTKGIKKTTRGYSTGAKELDKLKNEHPIIEEIIKYREATKLLNTYIIPMPELADKEGRIHTTFTQDITATGRLSSKDPNLQNIPVRTEEGKRIRTGFIAPQNKKLVSADYSQFELRLAAILANDQPLIDDFNSGVDIHTKTASEAFNTPMEQVTKAQRRAAKAINFGIIYGMSIKGLTDAAKMSFIEAKNFMENYQKIRTPIMNYMKNTLKKAEEQGYVETYFGRRRPTPDVKSSNFIIREAAKRAAANMPIQGTEADLMKRAMINISQKLPKTANLIMQVHDSLIVECDEKDASKIGELLKQEMENIAPELKIKLAVDVTIGDNWGML